MAQQREHELTVVLKADCSADDLKRIIAQLEKFVAAKKGTMLHLLNLGKRQLAYEIDKETRGIYLYLNYVITDGSVVTELEQFCRHEDNVMRYLTVLAGKEVNLGTRQSQHEADLKKLEQYLGVTLITKTEEQVAQVPAPTV